MRLSESRVANETFVCDRTESSDDVCVRDYAFASFPKFHSRLSQNAQHSVVTLFGDRVLFGSPVCDA